MAQASTRVTPAVRRQLAIEMRQVCMRISRRNRFESTEALAPHQFSVLVQLEKGVDRPSALARAERVSAPSMTRTVSSLVERGLVARSADPDDGRASVLSLTSEGRQAMKLVRRSRDAWMISRIDRLTDEECRTLQEAREILARVADS
jgi:DNA-binding MarR family transcriptional regulator